jgi:hypothetical protein
MGKKLLASALVHLPNLSGRGAENIVACIVESFCADSGIPFDPEQVANSCAKCNTLTQIVENNGIETIHEVRELIKNVDLYLALGLRQRQLPKRYQCFCKVSHLVGLLEDHPIIHQ